MLRATLILAILALAATGVVGCGGDDGDGGGGSNGLADPSPEQFEKARQIGEPQSA